MGVVIQVRRDEKDPHGGETPPGVKKLNRTPSRGNHPGGFDQTTHKDRPTKLGRTSLSDNGKQELSLTYFGRPPGESLGQIRVYVAGDFNL